MEELKYPIGQFERPENISKKIIDHWISDIKLLPERISEEIQGLTKDELNWIYRPDGWSIKQLVHHCADSHINAFTRLKLAITEERPTIRPYMEGRWAELPDSLDAPITWSLQLLTGLHARWGVLLESLDESDLQRSFFHPEHGDELMVNETIGSYAWHCNHHLAHVRQAKKYKGQFN